MSTSVWISLRLEVTEVCIRQILTHQSSPGECGSPERCSRGLVSPPNAWVAVPFEQELGTRQTTLSDVVEGLSRSLRKSLKELPGSLATERIKRARHEERARDMRVVDPEQLLDRVVIEGTGASSSCDGAGNEQEATGRPVAISEPQPRPTEPSVGDDQPPKEQSDDADMADPDSDRRRPRESLGEERETKRVRINVFDGEESDEWAETEEEWVRIHRRPRRELFSLHDSQGVTQEARSMRPGDASRSATRGTGSTRFRKSWGVLSDLKSENREHREEDNFLPDVNGGILDLRPTSQQGNRWNLSDRKDQRKILWLVRKKHPKLIIGCGNCILFCTVLHHEQIRRGTWFLHDLSGNASKLSIPCMIRLECRHVSSTRLVTQETGVTENE